MTSPGAPLLDAVQRSAEQGFAVWCERHMEPRYGLPIKGRLYGALVVLSNLENGPWRFQDLADAISTDQSDFFGDRSIRNHTSARVANVLKDKGHELLTPSGSRGESGRTSAGTKQAGLDLIVLIRAALALAPIPELETQGIALVHLLYAKVFALLEAYQENGGIEVAFSASESIAAYISKLLDSHRANPGAVLQHLVGAKLELRLADHPGAVHHNSSATADIQTGRLGDFEIGSTVFHITKRATDAHYRKAGQNAENGRKVYLLVPDNVLRGVKEYAESFQPGFSKKVDIFSIEQFVAQNLDEMAAFEKTQALRQLRRLLETYNELIDQHERDRSLRVIIPDLGIT